MRNARSVWLAIFLGGLVAGTVDIGAASLISGRDPLFILHVIAGGLIGKDAAFSGGARTAVLGLLLQWAMSILIAAIYVFGTRMRPAIWRMWIPSGVAYGVIVFFVMNYVVVPLSAYRRVPHFTVAGFAENMAAMLLFGLIVSWCARRAHERTLASGL
jgi:uncharacterized membrane protein YagU involved in acid resistance